MIDPSRPNTKYMSDLSYVLILHDKSSSEHGGLGIVFVILLRFLRRFCIFYARNLDHFSSDFIVFYAKKCINAPNLYSLVYK